MLNPPCKGVRFQHCRRYPTESARRYGTSQDWEVNYAKAMPLVATTRPVDALERVRFNNRLASTRAKRNMKAAALLNAASASRCSERKESVPLTRAGSAATCSKRGACTRRARPLPIGSLRDFYPDRKLPVTPASRRRHYPGSRIVNRVLLSCSWLLTSPDYCDDIH